MKKFIPVTILIIGGIIFGQTVFSQGGGVGISPLTFELTANPGDVIENQVKVYNPSDATVGIRMEVEDFTVEGEIGHVKIEPAGTETYSLTKWVKMEPMEFVLNPAEQRFVKFTINIPENAEPGGHYGSVLARTTAVIGGEYVGAAVAGRVGALVLLSVAGEVEENLTIKDFSAPRYSEYGPIPFTLRFENKGTVHVKPKGFVTVTNWFGRKVADIEIPQRNVLPDSIRVIDTALNKKWLWAGKYTATLTGSYGVSNTHLVPAVITFWAFPWKVGIIILAVLVFFILTRRRWLAAFKVLVRGERVVKQ